MFLGRFCPQINQNCNSIVRFSGADTKYQQPSERVLNGIAERVSPEYAQEHPLTFFENLPRNSDLFSKIHRILLFL